MNWIHPTQGLHHTVDALSRYVLIGAGRNFSRSNLGLTTCMWSKIHERLTQNNSSSSVFCATIIPWQQQEPVHTPVFELLVVQKTIIDPLRAPAHGTRTRELQDIRWRKEWFQHTEVASQGSLFNGKTKETFQMESRRQMIKIQLTLKGAANKLKHARFNSHSVWRLWSWPRHCRV